MFAFCAFTVYQHRTGHRVEVLIITAENYIKVIANVQNEYSLSILMKSINFVSKIFKWFPYITKKPDNFNRVSRGSTILHLVLLNSLLVSVSRVKKLFKLCYYWNRFFRGKIYHSFAFSLRSQDTCIQSGINMILNFTKNFYALRRKRIRFAFQNCKTKTA